MLSVSDFYRVAFSDDEEEKTPIPPTPLLPRIKLMLEKQEVVEKMDLSSEEEEKEEVLRCKHCEFKTTYLSGLKQHIRKKHTNLPQGGKFECDICHWKYDTWRTLQLHTYKAHERRISKITKQKTKN
jgi:hypothetical protein